MKKLLTIILIAILFGFTTKGQNTSEIPLMFGKTPSQLSGIFVPNGEKIGGCNGYVRADESYDFQGMTAHSVIYAFCNDKLSLVEIGLFNKDLTRIVEFMTSTYGKPQVTMLDGKVNYKWTKESLSATLLYNKDDGKGIDLTITNKDAKPEMAKTGDSKPKTASTTSTKVSPPAEETEPAPCLTETLFDGFKCMLWGTAFGEMDGKYTKYEGGSVKKFDDYVKVNDDLIYEGIKTSTTIYSFQNGLFTAASMAMFNKDVTKIVKLWSNQYGDPQVVEGAGIFTNYEWHLKGLLLTITYIREKEDGIGVLASILREDENLENKKPAVQTSRTSSTRSSSSSVKGNSTSTEPKTKTTEVKTPSTSTSGGSARDRLREKSGTKDESVREKATKVDEEEEEEVEEEVEEVEEAEETSPATEPKSARELMREKKR